MTTNQTNEVKTVSKTKLNIAKIKSVGRLTLIGIYGFIIILFILSMSFRLRYHVGVGNGKSMNPTLAETNFQIMDKKLAPDYGDIVGIKIKADDEQYAEMRKHYKELTVSQMMTKRVIALPGDDIKIDGNSIYVNNELVDTAKWFANNDNWNSNHDFDTEQKKLAGYFVMGDNRGHSFDSAYFGAVYEDDIMGTLVVYTNDLTMTRIFSTVFFLDPFLLRQP